MKYSILLGFLLPGLAACGGTETVALPPPPPPEEKCNAASAAGIEVAESDVYGGQPYALGYPPYAIDGCRLAYVARSAMGTSGELRLRDLTTGKETVLAPASEEPRRPTVSGDWVAWEGTIGGVAVIRYEGEGKTATIEGAFDHATEPRAGGGAIAFTAWLGPDLNSDTDVYVFEPATAKLTAVGATPGQQRFPDVSATHVAWADFFEDPDHTFDQNETDLADVVLYDRATLTATARPRKGKQAFPLLGATGKLAYLDWGAVHPEPKFSAYGLYVADLEAPAGADAQVEDITTQLPFVRPAARGKLLEWVEWPPGQAATLQRRPADLSAPAASLPGLEGLDLFAPTASEAITLVGTRAPGAPVVLKAFAR